MALEDYLGSQDIHRSTDRSATSHGGANSQTERLDSTHEVSAFEAGRYEVGAELGRGGLAHVALARDTRLNRRVALKTLRARSDSSERRFIHEALVAARLEHPGIIPVYDVGVDGAGAPYLSMKYVGGGTLAAAVTRSKTLTERLALVPALLLVADAMAYAHSEGVIHRDLKPANVLLGAFGEAVVVDWGIAKNLRAQGRLELEEDHTPTAIHTRAGSIVGTPGYMAPEQAVGDPVDERTDVYALGALLYTIVTGRPPFRGKSARALIEAVLTTGPACALADLHGVTETLSELVARAMARDPEERHANARLFADELRSVLAAPLVPEVGACDGSRATKTPTRRSLVAAAAAAFTFVLLCTIVWLVAASGTAAGSSDHAAQAPFYTSGGTDHAIRGPRSTTAAKVREVSRGM